MTTLTFSKIRETDGEYKHRYAATISTDKREAARVKLVMEKSGFSPVKKTAKAPNGAFYTLWRIPATKQAAARLLKDSYAMRDHARIDQLKIQRERIESLILQITTQSKPRARSLKTTYVYKPERVKADTQHAGRITKLIDRIGAESRQDMPAMLAWRAIEQGAV